MAQDQLRYKGKDKTLYNKLAKISDSDDAEFCWADFGNGKSILMLKRSFEVCNDK